MRCQSCGKKEANVKYYENINGKKQTLYFCEECAKKIGFSNFSDISSLFSPIFTSIPEFDLLEKKKCNMCGCTIDDYLKSGMLGCENCYKVFEDNINELIYKINGKNKHIKLSEIKNIENEDAAARKKYKIKALKEELENMVKEEKYEEAAIIRDEIKSLNEKGDA